MTIKTEEILSFIQENLNISQARLSRIVGITEHTLIKWKSISFDELSGKKKFKRVTSLAAAVVFLVEKGVSVSNRLNMIMNPSYQLSSGQYVSIAVAIRELSFEGESVLLLVEKCFQDFIQKQKEKTLLIKEGIQLVG